MNSSAITGLGPQYTLVAPKPPSSSKGTNSAQEGAALGDFADALSVQGGEAVINPSLDLAVHVPVGGQAASVASSGIIYGPSGLSTPPSASQMAAQIVKEIGMHGEITLSQAEQAMENTPAGDVANSQANIEEDFERMSGGSDKMSLAQLTSGIQATIDDGGFSGSEAIGGLVANGVVTGATTITYVPSK